MTDSTPWTPTPRDPDVPPQTHPSPPAHHSGSAHPSGSAHQSDQQVSTGAVSVDAPPPSPAPARRRRGRALGLVAGALVLALVAGGVWAFFLRPSPGATASDSTLVDLTEAPEEAWTFKYAPRGDEEWVAEFPSIQPVGEDRFVIKADLNSATYYEQNSSSWYSGYDEHYTTGYADGQRFKEAEDDYYEDSWANSYPSTEDYFSLSGATYEDAVYGSGYQGWSDGFSDGQLGRSEGASRAQRPADPPTLGFIALVDRSDGEEVWRVELDDLDVQPDRQAVLHQVSAEGHLVVTVAEWDEEVTTRVISLDPSNGSVVSEHELVGYAVTGGGVGGPLLAYDEETVMRLNTADLGGDYVWSAAIPGIEPNSGPSPQGDYVQVYTYEGTWWLNGDTGFEPAWFDEPEPDVNFRVLDDVVLRLESSSFGYYVDALDRDGEVLWTTDAEHVLTPSGSGGQVLLVAESSSEGNREFLMRLDPRTGEQVWEEEYAGEFRWAHGTVPGGLVLQEEDRSVVVDLETGERAQRLRGIVDYLGTTVAYGSDDTRARAWDLSDGTELWSLRLSDSETLRRGGDALFVLDTARRELSLLE